MPTDSAPGRPARSRRRSLRAPRILPPASVAAAVSEFSAPGGTARFAAGKALAATAQHAPGRVYPHFGAIAAQLDSDSQIVRWEALQILAELAAADVDRRIDRLLGRYLSFIRCGNLVSAANAVKGAAQIASARPDLLRRIVPAILGVERATYKTDECRNVAIQQALRALCELGPRALRLSAVTAFVRRQLRNPRPAVRRVAQSAIRQQPIRGSPGRAAAV
ncbi:MAG: hypothetical protein U1A27_12160 [Phycisphaerae bacterium]